MGLFKKRIRQADDRQSFLLAERIASWILIWQRRWADYLNACVSGFSVRRKLAGLALFCVVSAGYLLYLLISSII